MSHPSISIIGAGISGCTLARHLQKRGIPFTIYDKRTPQPAKGSSYGMQLQRMAYLPLKEALGLDLVGFEKKASVVRTSREERTAIIKTAPERQLRVNRELFEGVLREGLEIKYDHELESISNSSSNAIFSHRQRTTSPVQMRFTNGEEASSDTVIAADGTHSDVRALLSSSSQLEILPYVVYNGRRTISHSAWAEQRLPSGTLMQDHSTIVERRVGDVLMQITIARQFRTHVDVRYTYSRPARSPEADDPLFTPDRLKRDASIIPEALFAEVNALEQPQDSLFAEVFNADAMRHDRLLNWLMRSVLVPQADLQQAAKQGIVLIGDAAHHVPILGSYGANVAMDDARILADHIAQQSASNLSNFCDARYALWTKHVEDSTAQLAAMHGQDVRAHL